MKFLFVLLLTTGLVHAQDWPQFRGPTGDGHAVAKNLPVKWSKTENIAWHVDLPGKGWSSPAFVGGKLYLTAATLVGGGDEHNRKADRSLRALCLDAATGKTLWDAEVFKQDGASAPDSIHEKNGHASPSPIVEGDRIYVHFGHQGTACLDLKGNKIWENRKIRYQPQHGNGGSPIIVDGHLIFACDGSAEQFIVALDCKNGEEKWRFIRPTDAKRKFAFSTATCIEVDGKKQVISPGADVVNALDPATGKEIWRVRYEGYSIVPKPVYGNGLVYVSTAFDTPEVLAIDPKGSGDITDTHVKWVVDKRPPMTPSMIVDGELLYWVADGGFASAVNALTGEVYWYERAGKGCSASPILSEGKIYIQDEQGNCTIMAAGREAKILSQNSLEGERTLASYAVTDGTIFIRTETGLYCVKEKK